MGRFCVYVVEHGMLEYGLDKTTSEGEEWSRDEGADQAARLRQVQNERASVRFYIFKTVYERKCSDLL